MTDIAAASQSGFPAARASRGFSLVELVIVVAMVAIILSIALPAYQDFVQRQRVSSAVTTLHSALVLARSEAVKRNTPIVISAAGGDWGGGWSIARPGGGALILSQPVLSGVDIAPVADVTFTRMGRTTETDFEISSEQNSSIVSCLRLGADGRAASEKGGC